MVLHHIRQKSLIAVSFGLIVTEVCCHKINMNTKEKDIIKRILKMSSSLLTKLNELTIFYLLQNFSSVDIQHLGIGGFI